MSIVALSACSSSGSTGSAAGGASASVPSGSGGTVGYVSYSLTSPNQQGVAAGLKAELATAGFTLKTVDSQGDVGKANSLMQDFISQKVKAIVTDSFGAANLQAGILAAKRAGIPVYLTYAAGPKPKNIALSIYQTSAAAETNQMLKGIGDSGSILVWTLPQGANCVAGVKVLDAILAKHPGIKVTQHAVPATGWAPDAASTTSAWLQSNPASGHLAIWGCWDGPNIGAVSALTAAGRSDVKVYGDYGEADAIALIQQKKYTATWYFDPTANGKQLADAIIKNSKVPYAQIKDTVSTQSGILVDQSNIGDFLKKYPSAIKGA